MRHFKLAMESVDVMSEKYRAFTINKGEESLV